MSSCPDLQAKDLAAYARQPLLATHRPLPITSCPELQVPEPAPISLLDTFAEEAVHRGRGHSLLRASPYPSAMSGPSEAEPSCTNISFVRRTPAHDVYLCETQVRAVRRGHLLGPSTNGSS